MRCVVQEGHDTAEGAAEVKGIIKLDSFCGPHVATREKLPCPITCRCVDRWWRASNALEHNLHRLLGFSEGEASRLAWGR